jgi:hypothetical protein
LRGRILLSGQSYISFFSIISHIFPAWASFSGVNSRPNSRATRQASTVHTPSDFLISVPALLNSVHDRHGRRCRSSCRRAPGFVRVPVLVHAASSLSWCVLSFLAEIATAVYVSSARDRPWRIWLCVSISSSLGPRRTAHCTTVSGP